MKIFQKMKTDEALEEGGVWVPIGDGAKVLVARFQNRKHRASLERLRKPHKMMLLSGRDLPEEIQLDITVQSMADGILMGWEGIEGDDGKPLPYNRVNAMRLLTELRDFRDLVAGLASESETFRKQEVEAVVGNSEPSSDGTTSKTEKTAAE